MALGASRHLCHEAGVVLTSLRGGPPMVARGDLAQDLIDLRSLVRVTLSKESTYDRHGHESATSLNTDVDTLTATTTASANHSSPLKFEPPTNLDPPPPVDVGPYARPFLGVVMDPRAAGPHTLVALRSLHRLLQRKSLFVPSAEAGPSPFAPEDTSSNDSDNFKETPNPFVVALEPLTRGILHCKFEQTDAGADEAVEMAIADLLALIVKLDRRSLQPETLMDAFNTVFVTRNTFVHSPALCYHFEDVLMSMCKSVFEDLDSLRDTSGRLILEFLVNQLLHTPLVGGDDEASREAQMAHDATRILCLRVARAALRYGFQLAYWTNSDLLDASNANETGSAKSPSPPDDDDERSILQIVQDDLCLSLLMTGQAIWAFQENGVSTGFISLEVLSEICSTLHAIWTITSLRKHLVSQFEAIFSGFYQRALVLLRKRWNPTDSATFHSNLYFDAGVEIILESLVDIMTLHDHRQTVAQGNGGSLETLFAFYDCNIKRSDIAVDLMVDLCRCTGSKVDEEGEILDTSFHGDLPPPRPMQPEGPTTPTAAANGEDAGSTPAPDLGAEGTTAEGYRVVPPHLRELCAEAITGGMRCLFKDDRPSEETKRERQDRLSILAGHVSPAPQSWSDLNRVTSSHHMRNVKSKKRLMRKAAQLFNKKSSKGIEFLVSSGVIEEPVTPRAIASFLRNALVVGLDKRAVGAYLGEVGKSPEAGKSPPVWQRDYFHKEVLETYCNLFRFERQSLLDGLRMFLAAFRLPGEAQQIDRILQAFSDSCSRVCDEGAHGSKVFSEDPKRASDVAYLLSFSIIMLNTDQHNDTIREDRKMSKADFVKNNTDYGRDITEKGKELPKEYLGAIYDSIREEEIRTEGEGADGSMTVERWKDVLRGSAGEDSSTDELPSVHDAEDLTELVLEHLWMPIMSSISALWGVKPGGEVAGPVASDSPDVGTAGMLGAQGARLGMDMAWAMLVGVRQLGRNDIFSKIFNCICKYSQLLTYTSDEATRSWSFANSVEAQGALVVALRVAREASDEIGVDGWKRTWLMLFELRDLQLLGGGVSNRRRSVIMETDNDLLKPDQRQHWNVKLLQGGVGLEREEKKSSGVSSMFGAVGRALFGSGEIEDPSEGTSRGGLRGDVKTVHGKENRVIWDELADSDDEDDRQGLSDDEGGVYSIHGDSNVTLGSQFESLLIQEDLVLNQRREMPVTGLEQLEDSQFLQLSQRARVRKRLSQSCDYAGLVSDSRFMDDVGINNVLQALISLIPVNNPVETIATDQHGETGDNGIGDFVASLKQFPVSPASEAFAEVLIAEVTLRNRDRLSSLWHKHLKSHYITRLESFIQAHVEADEDPFGIITTAMEKCISGFLRISSCAVQRGEICNEILNVWTMLSEIKGEEGKTPLLCSFDSHLGEGLWRITRAVDESSELGEEGWQGLLALTEWCANRGCSLPPVPASDEGKTVGLAEDDPALQAYRSLHFLLNASEVKESVPVRCVNLIRTLVAAGELRQCPKLSIAGLDLLHILCSVVESAAISFYREAGSEGDRNGYWKTSWMPVLECMAEACHASSVSSVRQHALSMLTDSFLENQGGLIPVEQLCFALGHVCVPMAGRRVVELRDQASIAESVDEIVIEIELCVGLIFKPFRHHIQNLASEGSDGVLSVWSPILNVLKQILKDENESHASKELDASRELTLEHLRNVIMVLINDGLLLNESDDSSSITSITWQAVGEMELCKPHLSEWQQAASS